MVSLYTVLTSQHTSAEFWLILVFCFLISAVLVNAIFKNFRMFVNEPVSISCSVVKKIK